MKQSYNVLYKKLIPYDVAHIILGGYMDYYHQFKRITKRAKYRFEECNWHGIQEDSRDRINLYRDIVGDTKKKIMDFLGDRRASKKLWLETKRMYFDDIANFNTRNIAETFYNSVFRHCHTGLGADESLMFVRRTGTYREFRSTIPIFHTFYLTQPFETTIQQIFHYYKFDVPFENLERDIKFIKRTLNDYLGTEGYWDGGTRIELLKSIFYRNKSAYIVGRMCVDEKMTPFVLPLLNTKKGIYVDCLLLEYNDISSIFSYNRSYFLADVDIVSETVDFLHTIMPTKNLSELYNSIGFEKHGKTVFYREYLRHMRSTQDKFVIAPGIKGMVMSVFMLPSLNMVFKVIKDDFDEVKKITEEEVKEKYRMVNLHDRVGRMTDAHMFEHLSFARSRFPDELLEELKADFDSKLIITKDQVIIKHLYVEKRMIPLDIFLEEAPEAEAKLAIEEYGNAIKQLISVNIFPGDMLLKNFGVTRLKRVVFYDYDEIGLLTDYNFRYIPEPRDIYEEMSSEPYYSIGEMDVFPEEFRGFLIRNRKLLSHFCSVHEDLFDAQFWTKIQHRIKRGVILDAYPYRDEKRFKFKYRTRRRTKV